MALFARADREHNQRAQDLTEEDKRPEVLRGEGGFKYVSAGRRQELAVCLQGVADREAPHSRLTATLMRRILTVPRLRRNLGNYLLRRLARSYSGSAIH